MVRRLAVLGVLCCSVYTHVEAALLINEVAWMGDGVSANNEWIELYNDGSSSVDVTDWTLTDEMNLNVELAGTVGAGQYAVLERTDDDSAPGAAFLIYTGALPNTGATLKLQRSDGSLEDQAAGGDNWENLGGDNTTKETAQLTSTGWVTGSATPGRKNVSVGTISATDEVTGNATQVARTATVKEDAGKKVAPTKLVVPDVELSLEVTAPTLGYVNQPIKFTVEPSGLAPVITDSLVYEWNFGDLGVGQTKETTHVFHYPGTYVVSVRAAYARHEQIARTEITIVPVAFSLTRSRAGDVQISNDAPYEIDLSGYVLKGSTDVVLPARTILLPNNTITVPRAQLESTVETMVVLYDTESDQVAMLLPNALQGTVQLARAENETTSTRPVVAAATTGRVPTPTPALASANQIVETPAFSFHDPAEPELAQLEPLPDEQTELVEPPRQLPIAAVASADVPQAEVVMWPYLGLITLLSVAFVGLYVGRSRNEIRPNLVLFDDYDRHTKQ